jgi:hypothetical protein
VDAARARLDAAAAGVTAVSNFWAAFSRLKEAVDALPDLAPLLRVAVEQRALVLDALRMAGATVPRETWEALGLGWLAPRGDIFGPLRP